MENADQIAVIVCVVGIVIAYPFFKWVLPNSYGWITTLRYGHWQQKVYRLFWPWGYYEKRLAEKDDKISLMQREINVLLKGERKREQGGQISLGLDTPKQNGKTRVGPYHMHGGTYWLKWQQKDWDAYRAEKVLVVTGWSVEHRNQAADKYYVNKKPPKGAQGKQPGQNQVCVVKSYTWKDVDEVKPNDFVISDLTDMPVEWEAA